MKRIFDLFALTESAAYFSMTAFLRGLLICLFLTALAWVTVTDWRTRRIPNRIPLLILALGFAALWLFPECGVGDRLLGFFAVSVPMLLLTMAVPGAFGGGDVKLLAACGWFLGSGRLVCGVVIGFLAAGCYGAFLLLTHRMGRRDSFALGPFLAVGLAVSVFVGDCLTAWYLGLS